MKLSFFYGNLYVIVYRKSGGSVCVEGKIILGCKAYPLQKQLQQALEMKMKQSSDEMLQKQYQAVLKQVEQVEKIMHYMKVVHGKMAMDMFVSYYIDGVRQKDIAYQYHMSLRTLQRRFQNYRSLLEEVFRHRIDCA